MDIQEQLAILRARVAAIQDRAPTEVRSSAPAILEEILSGEVRETAYGHHFETEKLYPIHHQHGFLELCDLLALPEDCFTPFLKERFRMVLPTAGLFSIQRRPG